MRESAHLTRCDNHPPELDEAAQNDRFRSCEWAEYERCERLKRAFFIYRKTSRLPISEYPYDHENQQCGNSLVAVQVLRMSVLLLAAARQE